MEEQPDDPWWVIALCMAFIIAMYTAIIVLTADAHTWWQ